MMRKKGRSRCKLNKKQEKSRRKEVRKGWGTKILVWTRVPENGKKREMREEERDSQKKRIDLRRKRVERKTDGFGLDSPSTTLYPLFLSSLPFDFHIERLSIEEVRAREKEMWERKEVVLSPLLVVLRWESNAIHKDEECSDRKEEIKKEKREREYAVKCVAGAAFHRRSSSLVSSLLLLLYRQNKRSFVLSFHSLSIHSMLLLFLFTGCTLWYPPAPCSNVLTTLFWSQEVFSSLVRRNQCCFQSNPHTIQKNLLLQIYYLILSLSIHQLIVIIMAAFIAKQMVGNQLSAVKGEPSFFPSISLPLFLYLLQLLPSFPFASRKEESTALSS